MRLRAGRGLQIAAQSGVEDGPDGPIRPLSSHPCRLRPWRELKLIAAPGAELPGEGDAEFLFRVGVAYLLTIGEFSFGPELNVDIVDGHATYLAGLALGVRF